MVDTFRAEAVFFQDDAIALANLKRHDSVSEALSESEFALVATELMVDSYIRRSVSRSKQADPMYVDWTKIRNRLKE
jgi:hypothetical protein